MGIEKFFPADAAKWLVKEVEKRGMPPSSVLEGTGLGADWLDHQNAILSAGQYETIVLNALRESGDPALGLTSGNQENYLSRFGYWGYTILSSPDWSHASAQAVRYWEITGSLVRLSFHQEGEVCFGEIHPALDTVHESILIFAVEKLLSALFASIRFTTGEPPPLREIHLSYTPPGHASLYHEEWAGRILFSQKKNLFSMDSSLLKRPINLANPQIMKTCLEQCHQAWFDLNRRDELVAEVRRLLIQSPGHFPEARQTAKELGMSPRTLRRRLRDRDTSFREILDAVRGELAQDYLSSTNLTIDEIASLMGYTETTSFRRFFRKWTGKSPLSFKQGAPGQRTGHASKRPEG